MSNILEGGKLAIRLPRVVTPEACVEKCSKLKDKIGHALGQAAAEGLTAYPARRAVVCDRAARVLCHAQTINEGFIQSDITQGGSDRLIGNPTDPSPEQIIAAAIKNGATEHSLTEVF